MPGWVQLSTPFAAHAALAALTDAGYAARPDHCDPVAGCWSPAGDTKRPRRIAELNTGPIGEWERLLADTARRTLAAFRERAAKPPAATSAPRSRT